MVVDVLTEIFGEEWIAYFVLVLIIGLGVILPVAYFFARKERLRKEEMIKKLRADRDLRAKGEHPDQLKERAEMAAAYERSQESEADQRARIEQKVGPTKAEDVEATGPTADAAGPRYVRTTGPAGAKAEPVRVKDDAPPAAAATAATKAEPIEEASAPEPIDAAPAPAAAPKAAPAAAKPAAAAAPKESPAPSGDAELDDLLNELEDLSG